MKRWLAAVVFGLTLTGVAHAAIDTYEFANDAERDRFRELTKELRCPKCQNQDIADSNAPIATDLRREIYRMLGEGKDNQQILDFMVARYGDFVLYKPALTSKTAVPVSWRSVSIKSKMRRCTVTSSALVGSSAMINAGRNATAMAMSARCFMPPESSCGYWRSRSSGRLKPTLRNNSIT